MKRMEDAGLEPAGLVVSLHPARSLSGFCMVSLGIPDQGWELKGEATGKKNVKNNCSLLCSRRRKRDTCSLVCERSGEQEGSADRRI